MQIIIPGGGITDLFAKPDTTSSSIRILRHGDIVDIVDPQPEFPADAATAAADWRFATFTDEDVKSEGWLEARFLGAVTPPPPVPFLLPTFVRACIRTELELGAGGSPDDYIAADYLIAWANLASNHANPPPDPARGGAGGPFLLNDAEWTAYVEAIGGDAEDREASANRRFTPASHTDTAAFVASRDMQAFRDRMMPPGTADDPYVVTFLHLFMARLVGLDAAIAVESSRNAGDAAEPMADILAAAVPDVATRETLIARAADYLKQGGALVNAETFIARSNRALNAALTAAYKLIVDHAPEFIPETGAVGEAPWFAVAVSELDEWKTNGLTENKPGGLAKVIEYFESTDHGAVTSAVAWCGAFVAHCLRKSGEPGNGSVIKAAAGAANWIGWGDTVLNLRAAGEIPKGALVVFEPMVQGSTGHVAFFERLEDGNAIRVIGGNQSGGKVSSTKFNRGKIVAIRWLSTLGVTETSGDQTSVGTAFPATRHDVDILTRTLFGEAVGEFGVEGLGDKAVQAVANVVLNRASARHRGKSTIAGVCLDNLQFSCWNGNGKNKLMALTSAKAGFDDCRRVAEGAVAGAFGDHTDGAKHYHATYIATPSWVRKSPAAKITLKIGHHIFYKGIR